MSHEVVVLASAGAEKYVGGTVYEITGKDISGATFQMALGGRDHPGTNWVAPDVNESGTKLSERVLKLKVSAAAPAGVQVGGTYWCWCKIADGNEIEPLRLQGPIVVR